jgi:hypothetical protein
MLLRLCSGAKTPSIVAINIYMCPARSPKSQHNLILIAAQETEEDTRQDQSRSAELRRRRGPEVKTTDQDDVRAVHICPLIDYLWIRRVERAKQRYWEHRLESHRDPTLMDFSVRRSNARCFATVASETSMHRWTGSER